MHSGSTRPNWTRLDPFLDPEGQPDTFDPENWAQNWVEPEKTGRVWPHYLTPEDPPALQPIYGPRSHFWVRSYIWHEGNWLLHFERTVWNVVIV